MRGLKMISTGRCLPRRSVTNKDMSELVESATWSGRKGSPDPAILRRGDGSGPFGRCGPTGDGAGRYPSGRAGSLCGMHDHTGLSGPQ